jgi:DNA-binding NarL/FixJ family response regulator
MLPITWSITMKIVIAEESPAVSTRLVAMLSEIEGVSIMGFAHTVTQAMEMVSASVPDVAIVGFLHPRGSAVDLLRTIHRGNPAMKVLVLTTHVAEFKQQYREAGAAFVFDKISELDVMVDILTLLCLQLAEPEVCDPQRVQQAQQ